MVNFVWMKQILLCLNVAAPLIAGFTFIVSITPPGGSWQGEAKSALHPSAPVAHDPKLGTTVFSYDDDLLSEYFKFMALCATSILGCLGALALEMLVLLCGFTLNDGFVLWFLLTIMFISLLCTIKAIGISFSMTLLPLANETLKKIPLNYKECSHGLFYFVGLVLLVRFVHWLWHLFCENDKDNSVNTIPDPHPPSRDRVITDAPAARSIIPTPPPLAVRRRHLDN